MAAHLIKETPGDAGLAGAASNAATALYGANELCGRPASLEELVEWSSALGGDVAAFLSDTGSTYCTGRGVFHKGDTVVPLEALAGPAGGGQCFVVQSATALATPAIFRALATSKYETLSTAEPQTLLAAICGGPQGLPSDGALYVNDLEAAAFTCSPNLGAVKRALLEREGMDAAVMSGSGSALLAMGSPRDDDPAAFTERFVRECSEHDGVEVRVWPVQFVRRESGGGWYACPK